MSEVEDTQGAREDAHRLRSAAANVPPVALLSLKMPAISSVVLGAVGLTLGIVFGHPQMGVLFVVGLGMALFNARMMQRNALRIVTGANPTKGAIVSSSMGRLALLTIVALAFGYFIRPDGLGVFFGLAVFQLIFMVHTMTPVMKEYRRQ